jgi:hypothetical protein
MKDNVSKSIQPTDEPWGDLVVSMLSVNNWSLEKTYRFVDDLRTRGLFDPKTLACLEQDEIVVRLKKTGYDRGTYMTSLFALRLTCLGHFVKEKGVDICTKGISVMDGKAIEQFLACVNGIGPKVIANFCILRGIPTKG